MDRPPRPLAETADSVTLSRRDYEALLDAWSAAGGAAAGRVSDGAEEGAAEGHGAAPAGGLPCDLPPEDVLPVEAVNRLVAGESPVRVWRRHRGLTLRAVAEDARVSVSYLSEIETRRKPGSVAALRSIAVTLRVPMERLLGM